MTVDIYIYIDIFFSYILPYIIQYLQSPVLAWLVCPVPTYYLIPDPPFIKITLLPCILLYSSPGKIRFFGHKTFSALQKDFYFPLLPWYLAIVP
jgi:hypothetical protein